MNFHGLRCWCHLVPRLSPIDQTSDMSLNNFHWLNGKGCCYQSSVRHVAWLIVSATVKNRTDNRMLSDALTTIIRKLDSHLIELSGKWFPAHE